jgi:hypothetical protein
MSLNKITVLRFTSPIHKMPQIGAKNGGAISAFELSAFVYANTVRPHTSCVDFSAHSWKEFFLFFHVLYNK